MPRANIESEANIKEKRRYQSIFLEGAYGSPYVLELTYAMYLQIRYMKKAAKPIKRISSAAKT